MEYLEESTSLQGLKISKHHQLMVISKVYAVIFKILIFWPFLTNFAIFHDFLNFGPL